MKDGTEIQGAIFPSKTESDKVVLYMNPNASFVEIAHYCN